MKFKTTDRPSFSPNQRLVYRREEHSFDTEPSPSDSKGSALINDIHLELDTNGKVVSIWGLCPQSSWSEKKLTVPSASAGEAYICTAGTQIPGTSFRPEPRQHYQVFADQSVGWVMVDGLVPTLVSVRLFQDAILEVGPDGEFSKLWLRFADAKS